MQGQNPFYRDSMYRPPSINPYPAGGATVPSFPRLGYIYEYPAPRKIKSIDYYEDGTVKRVEYEA